MPPRRKPVSKNSRSSTPKLQRIDEDSLFPEDYDWSSVETNRGAPARQYLLKSLTPYILDGLREVNKVRPENPVEWLGLYLRDASRKRKETPPPPPESATENLVIESSRSDSETSSIQPEVIPQDSNDEMNEPVNDPPLIENSEHPNGDI